MSFDVAEEATAAAVLVDDDAPDVVVVFGFGEFFEVMSRAQPTTNQTLILFFVLFEIRKKMEKMPDSIYVTGLNPNVTAAKLIEHFGSIGEIKIDKKTQEPKIWIYKVCFFFRFANNFFLTE